MTAKPAPTGVLESCLYASDLEAAERFYTGVVGLTLHAKEEGRHVFFKCGGQMVLIFDPAATEQPARPGAIAVPLHGSRGPGHLCFACPPGCIPEWTAHLADVGVAIEATVDWPNGQRSIYFRDPDGNSLEIAERGLWFRD